MKKDISEFLQVVRDTRSPKTHATYRHALRVFVEVVGTNAPLTRDTYIKFLRQTSNINPSTQATYRAAVMGLFMFCADQHPEINLAAFKQATRQYAQRRGQRLPNFDREAIEKVIAYCQTISEELIDLRDRAFVLSLADTGLRISEACALRRGDIDWKEGRAILIGKGDKEDVVRFSTRSLNALRDYLARRASLDGGTGKPLTALPLFVRHDKGAGSRIKPVGVGGMWAAVKERIKQAGLKPGAIRVHDFRHYFISSVYLASGGDIKLTQELARHSDISTTGRYTHFGGRADEEYHRIFNEGNDDRLLHQ